MNKCNNCGANIKSEFRFCPFCGTQIKNIDKKNNEDTDANLVYCNICGEETQISSGSCESCGAKISGSEIKISANELKKKKDTVLKQNIEVPGKVTTKSFPKKTSTNYNSGISTKSLLILIGGLALVGFLILEISGVLDSKVNENTGTTANTSQSQSSTVDLAALQEINALENNVRSDTTNLDNVLHLAHSLNDSGFFERAITYYNMYLRANPNNADVQVDLGVCYFELKQYEIAKTKMRKGLQIKPDHQIAHFNLGIVNLSQGNIDSANYWWEKAVVLNSNSEIGKKAKELLESHKNGGN